MHRPHWHTYDAEIDESPARITCDLAYFDRELRSGSSTALLILGAPLQEPTEAGLATEEESQTIANATSRIGESLPPTTLQVGGWTAAGSWQVALYTPSDLNENLIPTLESIVKEGGWEMWIHAEPDPNWHHYETFLQPPTRTRLKAINDRALTSLRRAGHDLTQPRKIAHKLSFPSREAAELALSSLHLLGFEPTTPPKTRKDHYTTAQVQREDPPNVLPALTEMLSEVCAPLDGDHIKWIATS
ncbi:hypothetical protein Poly30_11950 [Planctomycetes bacterium Poly30]|uniref:DUF695 domain-containing protein n=1 Tax=Saltatorellus ferox TaxID=2528018 RepID=A0A518ENM9_9BACT|nr:hypothetical protein Poly30_11950 [Planctomycetes bacterium Poly30]